jgi:cell division protein FtsX
MVTAWWLWVRTDLRRRLRPALVLFLLVALAGGVVMAAVAGGRRNGTAVERASALTEPSDAWVLVNQPGFDWDRVRALPEVQTVGEFPVAGFEVEGLPPELQDNTGFPVGSPEATTEIEAPIVVEGRVPDPDRVDEVSISPEAARTGLDVGDRLTINVPTPEQQAAFFTGEEPPPEPGPQQEVTVVGVTKGSFFTGSVQTTHAFFRRYEANLHPPEMYVNAVVKLRRGAADMPAFQAHMADLAGHAVEMRDSAAQLKRMTNATHLERDALFGFAVAAALAALVLVGQAIVRMVASSANEVPSLVALGFTRTGAAATIGALPAVAAAAGALGAGGLAYVLSDRFPIGVGRQAEPHLGYQADWAVLAPGIALIAAVALGGTLAVTALALRPRRLAVAPAGSRVAGLVGATNAPVPLVLGVRLALERGNGRTAVPVRPALVGAVVGVLGVVGALTFGTGLDRATTDPTLYGQSFDALMGLVGPSDDRMARQAEETMSEVGSRPEVAAVTEAREAIARIDGHDVALFGMTDLTGHYDLQPVRGRLPAAADEIALAPKELDALGVDVGDDLRIDGVPGTFTVTAEAFNPEAIHTAYDEGGQLTEDGYRRIFPTDDQLKFHLWLIRFTPGTDVAGAVDRLNGEVAPTDGLFEVRPAVEDQQRLEGVRRIPLLLGGFLAVLALGAVGHALASTVRRRRHDVAVLRALGLTRRQTRATVAWQATTLAIVGLVFGVPLGLALGRTIWRVVAERTPMLYVAPFALVAVLLVPPAAVALFNALAAWPGHLAARFRPADSLRTE